MADPWETGGVIIESGGVPVECATCPCSTPDKPCCFNANMYSCYKFALTTITANNGGTCDSHCIQLNREWTMPWISGSGGGIFDPPCTFRSASLTVGAYCSGCGTTYRANMTVTTSGENCIIQLTLDNVTGDDTCADGGNVYRGTFAKTTASMTSFVLTLFSVSTLCANWPATITVTNC